MYSTACGSCPRTDSWLHALAAPGEPLDQRGLARAVLAGDQRQEHPVALVHRFPFVTRVTRDSTVSSGPRALVRTTPPSGTSAETQSADSPARYCLHAND